MQVFKRDDIIKTLKDSSIKPEYECQVCGKFFTSTVEAAQHLAEHLFAEEVTP